MDRYYYAVQRVKELEAGVKDMEEDILSQLEAGAKLEAVRVAEEMLAAMRGELEDARTVQQYYAEQGDVQASKDITQVVIHGTIAPDRLVGGSLMPSVLQWGSIEVTVSGLLVQASDVVVGTIEGPQEAALGVANIILGTINGAILSTCRIQSRAYSLGLRLTMVEDDVLAKVIRRCRSIIVVGQQFAPKQCADVAFWGGNPCGIPVESGPKDTPLLCVALDTKGGLTPRTEDYARAAVVISGIVERHNGSLIEAFGEQMVIAFPSAGRFISNSAMDSAIRIIAALDNVVLGIHLGELSMINAPHCTAIGAGILQVKGLVELAEKNRRPLIVTPQATAHISRASYIMCNFSIDTVGYNTLSDYEMRRLNMPPDDLILDHIPGCVPEISGNTITYRKMRPAEQQQVWSRDTPNGGAQRDRELMVLFRKMDLGNCGWIGKAAFRRFLLEGSTYSIFPHDAKKVDGWINAATAIGPDRMSFPEFSLICLRLDQL